MKINSMLVLAFIRGNALIDSEDFLRKTSVVGGMIATYNSQLKGAI